MGSGTREPTLLVQLGELVLETGEVEGATPDGCIVRVRGALPAERVEVSSVHVRKDGVVFGSWPVVHHASPERVDRGCPNVDRCGGCDFLHADLDFQHRFKRLRVARALGRSVEGISPVVASPFELGYRAFAKLVVGPDGQLGVYRRRSHDVVDMAGCLVHAPELEQVVEALRAPVGALPAELRPRYITVRASLLEGLMQVVFVTRAPSSEELRTVAFGAAERPDVAQVFEHINDSNSDAIYHEAPFTLLAGTAPPRELVGSINFELAPGAFGQVNPKAAERLYETASRALLPADRVLELYAGAGLLSLNLLRRGVGSAVAVELNPSAVEAGRRAARAAGLDGRIEYCAAAAETALARLQLTRFDALLVNPPRRGLGASAIDLIRNVSWRTLVYVSCNPDSLARDIESLGGRLAHVFPVDLFPHTRHVETVAVLKNTSKL